MCNNPAFNVNRFNLDNHILVHLAKERSFDDYEDYINEANTYFERFIQGEVETSPALSTLTQTELFMSRAVSIEKKPIIVLLTSAAHL